MTSLPLQGSQWTGACRCLYFEAVDEDAHINLLLDKHEKSGFDDADDDDDDGDDNGNDL